jgi:hypothetical protein
MTTTNKNLQDLFKTYVAKSDGEEKFRKAHVISTVDNNDEKLGPKDDQFVATTKTYERDSTHHGYNAGGDEKVYSEEALDEMSSKMKMKLGLYGKKKKMEEEVEELDETSKAKLGRYINKAKDSIDMTSYRSGIKDGTAISRNDPYTSKNPLERKLSKRHKGIEMAVKKLTREEAELDEATLNPEDERHFEKQTPKMQAAINLHLRKGMDYEDAVAAARRVFSEEVELDEKKLTKAELKKREEVATAMERENPGMDMSKKMAIATAQAKKVAEEFELDEGRLDRIVQGAISIAKGAKGYAQQAMARMRTVPPAPAGTPRLPAPGATNAPQVGILPRNRSVVTTLPTAPRAPRINPKRAAAVAGAVAVGSGGTYLATRDSSASAAPKATTPAAAPKATTPTTTASTSAPAAAPAAAPKATTSTSATAASPAAAAPKATAGNSSGSYKVKGVDVTKDVKDITKANPSIKNPNMIRAGQTIKVGDSDYKVQKGDTLSGIAASRKSTATPAAAPKAATASTTPEAPKAAPEAPKANDFSDVKSDSGPIAAKHDDHTQGYDNKSRKQIKADARAAIRTQRVLAKASKLQTTRGDEYSAAYANRKMADIAGDTEKAYGHEDQASAHYGKRAEYGRNMNIIRKNNSIAAAQANKVQEEIELGEAVNSDDAFDRLEKAGAKDVKTTSGGIRYTHGGKEYNLRHNMKRTGHRTVRSAELEQHLNRLQEETEVVEEQFAPGRFKQVMVERALNALDSYVYGENNLDD